MSDMHFHFAMGSPEDDPVPLPPHAYWLPFNPHGFERVDDDEVLVDFWRMICMADYIVVSKLAYPLLEDLYAAVVQTTNTLHNRRLSP